MAFNEDDEQTNLEFNKLLQSLGSKNRLADFSQQIPEEISSMTLTPDQQKEEADMDAALNEVMSMSSGPSLASEAPIVQEPTAAPQMDESAPAMISNRYADLLKQYNQTLGSRDIDGLQDQRRTGQLVGAGLTAGNKIAQAIAMGSGAKIDAGADAGREVERLYAQPLEDYKEKQKQLLEEVKGLKSQSDISSELQMNDPKSDVSNFMRQQAYSLLNKIDPDNKMDLAGSLEGMTASQLEKLPGLKNAMSSGNKSNNRYVTVQEPDGTIRSKLIDMSTGETIKDLGLAGYAYGAQIDPVTGQLARISKSDPNRPMVKVPGQDQQLKGKSTEEVQKPKSVGEYRKSGIIAPKEWDMVVTKDKEGFEQANKDKINIISSLKSIDNLVDEATKNPNAAASLGGIVGSLFEPGKLTDEDAKRYVKRLGLSNRFQDFMSGQLTGTITKDLANEIKKTSVAYRGAMDGVVRNNAVRYSKATANSLVAGDQVDPEILADFYYQKQGDVSDMVKIKTPKGTIMSIPKSKLEEAKKKGAQEVK